MRGAPSGLGRHAASLLPRGEKDRMRGFGTHRTICNVRTPSPPPPPPLGEGVRCASCCGLSWQTPPFSRRVSASEFFLSAIERGKREELRGRQAASLLPRGEKDRLRGFGHQR